MKMIQKYGVTKRYGSYLATAGKLQQGSCNTIYSYLKDMWLYNDIAKTK